MKAVYPPIVFVRGLDRDLYLNLTRNTNALRVGREDGVNIFWCCQLNESAKNKLITRDMTYGVLKVPLNLKQPTPKQAGYKYLQFSTNIMLFIYQKCNWSKYMNDTHIQKYSENI